MQQAPVKCLLLINGQFKPMALVPYMGSHGVGCSRHGSDVGPHFHFGLSATLFTEVLNRIYESDAEVELSLDNFGSVSALHGRPACDSGSLVRPIESLKLRLKRGEGSTEVTFSGRTGVVDPRTDLMPGSAWPPSNSPYAFSLSFQLEDQSAGAYFSDIGTRESFLAYVKRLSASNG